MRAAKQPIQRWKRPTIDYRCNTNDNWVALLVTHRYRAQTPGLPAEELRYAGALRICGRCGYLRRIHRYLTIAAHLTRNGLGSMVPRIRCLPIT